MPLIRISQQWERTSINTERKSGMTHIAGWSALGFHECEDPIYQSPKLCFCTLGINGPGWFRGCKDLSISYMCVSCPAPRTCCLACSRARGGSQGWSQTLGDRLACTALPISIWSTYYVPNTIWRSLFGMVVVIIVHLLTVGLVVEN